MRRKIEKTISLEVYQWEELPSDVQKMFDLAKVSVEKAYAPYSDFMVGAVVQMENGELFAANNQENVSFPNGICAEKLALSYSSATFPELRPAKIAILAKRRNDNVYAAVTPCGICRQTINEYEQKFEHPIEIYMQTPSGEILKADGIDVLLPFKFADLKG